MKRLIPILLIVLGIAAYSNTFLSPFLFDDYPTIVNKSSIKQGWVIFQCPRPLGDLTFRLNYMAGGLNVADYHLVNILIHIAAGLLFFGVLRRTLRLKRFAGRYEDSADWLAAAVSGLWLLHPLQTQSVTYICQRYESLMGMLTFLALYAFIRAQGSARARAWTNLAIIACIFGMGVKQSMIIVPVLLIVYDYVFLAGSPAEMLRLRWKSHLAFFATIGVLFAQTFRYMSASADIGGDSMFVRQISPFEYLLTQCGVIVHYLRLTVFPSGQCLDYAWQAVDSYRQVLPQLIFLVIVGVLTLVALFRRSPGGYAWFWFFVALAPASSFMPTGDMAFEHRMYLPLAGPLAFAVLAWHKATSRICSAEINAVLAVSLILLMGVITFNRNAVYGSTESMWRDVISKSPDNYRQRIALTSALLGQGRLEDAETEARALLNRMVKVQVHGTNSVDVVTGMGSYYYPGAENQLGLVLVARGKVEEALPHFERALNFRKGEKELHQNYALALMLSRRYEDALREVNMAVAADRNYIRGYGLKASILEAMGRDREAVDAYKTAIGLAPDGLPLLTDYAWLISTSADSSVHDPAKAVSIAERVEGEMRGQSVRSLDVLAAAYADAGRFKDAVAVAERAESLAAGRRGPDADGKPDKLLPEIRARLEQYRSGKPWRSATTSPR